MNEISNSETTNKEFDYYNEVLQKFRPKTEKDTNLSVLCITCKEDLHYLRDMLLSLPLGCEVILYYSEYGAGEAKVEKKNELGLNLIVVNDYFESFSFSEILNKAQKYATKDWILRIDTDERLCWNTYEPNQHPQFFDVLNKMPGNVGGVYIHVNSELPPDNKYYAGRLFSAPIIRLYRNKGFHWINRVHEQIHESIKSGGYEIKEPILNFPKIEHVGYYKQEPAKLLRNLKLMCQDIGEEAAFDEYKLYMLYRTINDIHNLNLFRSSPYGND